MSESTAREGVTVIDLDAVEAKPATPKVEMDKVALSIPVDLHDRLRSAKVATKRSVNALIRDLIAAGIEDIEAEAKTAARDALAEKRAELAALEAAAGLGDDESETEGTTEEA